MHILQLYRSGVFASNAETPEGGIKTTTRVSKRWMCSYDCSAFPPNTLNTAAHSLIYAFISHIIFSCRSYAIFSNLGISFYCKCSSHINISLDLRSLIVIMFILSQ